MKLLHYIFYPEIVSKQPGELQCKVIALDDYEPADFNIHLALAILKAAQIISADKLEHYRTMCDNYMYYQLIDLPTIQYRGELADVYTLLKAEETKLMDDPDYKVNIQSYFNHVHFGDDMPADLPNVDEQRDYFGELNSAMHKLMQKIEAEIGAKVKTTAWPRKPNNYFDYSVPTTLTFETYKHDESLEPAINAEAGKYVKSFSYTEGLDDIGEKEWLFTIHYNTL